ncbi:MAG TPA: CopD family protein [Acidimicrobiia bacterium]
MIRAADPLDDFLEGAGAGSELGERLETIGVALALPGIVIAVGLIVFLLFVHKRGSSEERMALLRALAVSGLVVLVGGLVEVVGAVAVGGGTWIEDLADTSRSPLIRLLAGTLMTVGFVGVRSPIPEPWRPAPRQIFGVIGAVSGGLSFATDGHTISEGNLFLSASLDVIHVLAAGVWVGGVVGLFLMSLRRSRGLETSPMAPTIVRFSTVATVAIVAVAAAGAGMSFLIVDSISDYYTTTWGKLLLVKVGLVVLAGGFGAYNHYVVVPALEVDASDTVMLARARSTISAEVVLLFLVALVTVFLAGASVNQNG